MIVIGGLTQVEPPRRQDAKVQRDQDSVERRVVSAALRGDFGGGASRHSKQRRPSRGRDDTRDGDS